MRLINNYPLLQLVPKRGSLRAPRHNPTIWAGSESPSGPWNNLTGCSRNLETSCKLEPSGNHKILFRGFMDQQKYWIRLAFGATENTKRMCSTLFPIRENIYWTAASNLSRTSVSHFYHWDKNGKKMFTTGKIMPYLWLIPKRLLRFP